MTLLIGITGIVALDVALRIARIRDYKKLIRRAND